MDTQVSKRILVVDDEQSIVNAVRRELHTPPLGRFRYEVEGFSDPAEALSQARAQRFDAVVSDYRMPGMDGLEFLKRFAELQPDCARLVLSGQTDMEALTRMINETHIYRFIPKPWHDYYLKSSVAQAIEFSTALRENKRLAGLVRERNIPIPQLVDDDVEHILIVDDDPGVLASLSRLLTTRSRVDDLYSVIRAELTDREGASLSETKNSVQVSTSPLHALRMAEGVLYSCILADYKMPEMNGIDLLEQFADRQPYCQRILISGQMTQEDLVNAVDVARIFGFVAKPWQDYELKACVAQALAHRRMLLENRILAEMVKRAGGTAA